MNVPQNDADRRFKCNNRASRHSSWVFDTLEIGKYIDEVIPKTRHHNITHGTGVKALSLNGLGYNEGRLFLMPVIRNPPVFFYISHNLVDSLPGYLKISSDLCNRLSPLLLLDDSLNIPIC